MKAIDFLKECVRQFRTVGTLVRSSPFICKRIAKSTNLKSGECIVELGAGDGVITNYLLETMPSDATLIAFELNDKFSEKLKQINDPRLIVVQDDANNIGHYLDKYAQGEADCVVSTLPYVMWPDEVGIGILTKVHQRMKPGARYIQIHYSLLAKKLYLKIFGNLKLQFEPFNLPPAFIYISHKN